MIGLTNKQHRDFFLGESEPETLARIIMYDLGLRGLLHLRDAVFRLWCLTRYGETPEAVLGDLNGARERFLWGINPED